MRARLFGRAREPSGGGAARTEAAVSGWRSALNQGGLIMIGYALIALVGMGALRVYTELAPKDVFGESNLVLTLVTLGMQLFIAPFTNTQLRYHTEAQSRGDAEVFTLEVLRWGLRAAAVLGGVAFATCMLSAAMGGPPLGAGVAAAVLGWVFATTIRNVLMNRLQAERRRLTYLCLMVVEALLTGTLTAVALSITATTGSFLAGQVLAAGTLLLILLRYSRWPSAKRVTQPGSMEFREKAVQYGLPFAPLAVVGWLANLADRYVLGAVLGAAAVGQYLAPLSIASRAMIMASSALNDFFRPSLFDAENRHQPAEANRVFVAWVAANAGLGCVAVTFIAVAGKPIVGVLLGERYREGAVPIMLWIALGYAVYGLTQVLETRLLSLGRSGQLIAPMAAGALANVVLSVLLVARHGILGAAQASCLSFLAQSAVTAAFLVTALRRQGRSAATPEVVPCR